MRHTPWKKSRSYGNNYGGAAGRYKDDHIRAHLHSFHSLGTFEDVPVIRVDNPSRDWFHPLNAEQIRYALKALPPENHGDISHVWLRRGGSPFQGRRYCVTDSIWGGGVSLVTLYPTRYSLIRKHGVQKPSQYSQRIYRKYEANLRRNGCIWQTIWTLPGLRKFYIQEALYSSVAYHSAYQWRSGRCNSAKAREQRMEDWLYRWQALAERVYQDLFA